MMHAERKKKKYLSQISCECVPSCRSDTPSYKPTNVRSQRLLPHPAILGSRELGR